MNYKMVLYTIGRIFLVMGALLLIPMFVAIGYGEDCLPYIYTICENFKIIYRVGKNKSHSKKL